MVSNGDTADVTPNRTRFRFELPAEPAGVPRMRHELTQWAEEIGVHEDVLGNVRLAVTEAVTNAVVHAYVGRTPETVAVEARPGRDELVVRVTDRGRGHRAASRLSRTRDGSPADRPALHARRSDPRPGRPWQ